MAESFALDRSQPLAAQYAQLQPQLQALLAAEHNPVANMANMAALLKEAFGFWWVGFYMVEGETLVLGPFQGPLACTRIGYGKGVCGSAWAQQQTLVVPDVAQFPGHIACSSASQSEVVIPIVYQGSVWGVLDVDSEHLDHFSPAHVQGLQSLVAVLEASLAN